jgi:hypothetical protein
MPDRRSARERGVYGSVIGPGQEVSGDICSIDGDSSQQDHEEASGAEGNHIVRDD